MFAMYRRCCCSPCQTAPAPQEAKREAVLVLVRVLVLVLVVESQRQANSRRDEDGYVSDRHQGEERRHYAPEGSILHEKGRMACQGESGLHR